MTVPKIQDEEILGMFEAALRSGAIQPYYQPVIRTLSRQLCSFEVLARWKDPLRGVIYPDQFIPVLEKAQKIHLLDGHIIRSACAQMRSRIEEGSIPIPISVNLSRLDFILCDIYAVVQEAVNYYQLPHEYLYIEITETVAMFQDQAIHTALDRFREAGFQIWMDDFGSGYSSLNVLKDLDFNEIKLDMRFLSSFDQRSKRIMASVIQMAKEIGIHTLAEGVESEDQERFLRNIGCEKVQGFYLGKPLPLKQALEELALKNIQIEKPMERVYYDEIGKINLLSAVPFMTQEERDELRTARQLNSIPLAIGEVRKDSFRILFYNTAFEDTARSTGIIGNIFSQEQLNKPMPFSLLPTRLWDLLDSIQGEEEGKLRFASHGQYYEIQAKCIARCRENYSVLLCLNNLSISLKSDRLERLDLSIRRIYALFFRVTLIDLKNNRITPLYVSTREELLSGKEGIRELAKEFAKKWIFPEDQKAYLGFLDFDKLQGRILQTGRGYISDYFRTYVGHGQYTWKKHILLSLEEGMYLELIQDAHAEERFFHDTGKEDREGEISPALLWENLIRSDILRLFWKDENRRFLGASQSFLSYYGFNSQKDILGKNDEELGWHIHPDDYMNDESQVLLEGITTHHIPGKCFSQGQNREILASKTPLYNEEGKIRGLIGFFLDKEILKQEENREEETLRRDGSMGILNSQGIYEEACGFRDEYYLRNVDFARIHVGIENIQSINLSYGFDIGDKALLALALELKKTFGRSSAVGRYKGNQFVILTQVRDHNEIDSLMERLRQMAATSRRIQGIDLTLYICAGYALYSETEDLEEQVLSAEKCRLADHNNHTNIESRLAKATELFSMYDTLPISYAVYKVKTDEKGKVYDAEFFYVNHLFEERAGKNAREILGRGTRELFPDLSEDWYEKAGRSALQGESIIETLYFYGTEKYYYMTSSMVIRKGFCSFTYQEIDMLKPEVLEQEKREREDKGATS